MITRIRLVVLLARPAVVYLLTLYTALGAERGGGASNAALAVAFVSVLGFLLFSVAVNDIADEAIDGINLPHDRRRPLVTGAAGRGDMATAAVAGLLCALVGAAILGERALVATAVGVLISAAYSLRPVRLADRGAVASLVLPACYVAVPYLDGIFATGSSPSPIAMLTLAGLYLGFIGRILLKDFRDVRGDALFGKRTFLVRHGRRATCAVSAITWTAGTAIVALCAHNTTLYIMYAITSFAVCALLRDLVRHVHPRADELRISALAIIGRGTMLMLLAQLYTARTGWSTAAQSGLLAALAVLTTWLAARMLRHGPAPLLTTRALGHIATPERESADIVAG